MKYLIPMITKIEIKNVKGLDHRNLNLELLPNKVNLLVAPNGYGKSSIAKAFKSLNRNRINLEKDDYFKGNSTNLPELSITYKRAKDPELTLKADSSTNEIMKYFSISVFTSPIYVKVTKLKIGGTTIASGELSIKDIVLFDKIPTKVNSAEIKKSIKGNLQGFYKYYSVIEKMIEHPGVIRALDKDWNRGLLKKSLQIKNSKYIDDIYSHLVTIIAENKTNWDSTIRLLGQFVTDLQLPGALDLLNKIFSQLDFGLSDQDKLCKFFLFLFLVRFYKSDANKFKEVFRYKMYIVAKTEYEDLYSRFNIGDPKVLPKVVDKQLIIKFPNLGMISNGQRDILSFISMLTQAKIKFIKDKSILIIDEVFDYLDESNLIAAQYYLSQFIEQVRVEGNQLYVIIFTHLDPNVFKSYTFSKKLMEVTHLLTSRAVVAPSLIKLLKVRNDDTNALTPEIKNKLLHFNPEKINKRSEFSVNGLKETWGEGDNFLIYCEAEFDKYKKQTEEYDPLATCIYLRRLIEEKIYSQLSVESDRFEFIKTHKTRSKLEFATDRGIEIPEVYFLLGLVYNPAVHWVDEKMIAPLEHKLKNRTIHRMICDL
jgi:energy-coupling factor transporter ATP-binding protein EcfA2